MFAVTKDDISQYRELPSKRTEPQMSPGTLVQLALYPGAKLAAKDCMANHKQVR